MPVPTTPAPDDRRAAAVCLLHLPGLALLAAFIPGAPPPRYLSLIHAVGVVMVAARVLFSGRRFGAIADIGESGAATAIRRAMLLCSLLGSVVRFLLVIPRQGRHFWAAARAQLVTKSSGWAACCYAQSRAPTPTRSVYLLPVRWRSPPKKDSRWPCTPPRSAPPTVSDARRGRSCLFPREAPGGVAALTLLTMLQILTKKAEGCEHHLFCTGALCLGGAGGHRAGGHITEPSDTERLTARGAHGPRPWPGATARAAAKHKSPAGHCRVNVKEVE